MALGARELLIILRAQDFASREVEKVAASFTTLEGTQRQSALASIQQGGALLAIGTAFTLAGGLALKFYGGAIKDAVEYNKEVAYTATQLDGGAQKLKELGQIGIDVAKNIPAPFKEMQSSLYDIFSSTNANITQSQILLEAFAKGAVAGQTDVQTAGRATISIMNAFHVPFEDVNHVMDIQFKIVRDGVITYEQLAGSIGRAIPAAVKAGQSMEDLGGMIAFMTRNGLSAAQAATSAARALDMLSNPEFRTNMEAFGVSVTDANGAFRPMIDVTEELRKKFGELAPAQRTLEFLKLGGEASADALKQLGINAYDANGQLRPMNEVGAELVKNFKGMSESEVAAKLAELTHGAGGTIQAMRFLNLAVTDSSGLYKQLTDDIRNSGGAAETAYQIMRKTPAMQVQLLSNQWQIIKTQIGEGLIPVFSQFLGVLNDILHWWINLDDGVKNTIATFGLVIAIFTTLFGLLTITAGAVKILGGAIELLEGGTGAVILSTLGWTLVIAAAITAIMVLEEKTHFLQTAFGAVSDFIKDHIIPRFNELKDAFDKDGISGVVSKAADMWSRDWPRLVSYVENGVTRITGYLVDNVPKWYNATVDWISTAADNVSSFLDKYGSAVVDWTITYAPEIAKSFAEWTVAAWDWVSEAVPIAFSKLYNFDVAVYTWIGDQAVKLGKAWLKWADQLWKWIVDATPIVLSKLDDWRDSVTKWIEDNYPTVRDKFETWKEATWSWLVDIGDKLDIWVDDIKKWIKDNAPKVGSLFESWIDAIGTWLADNAPGLAEKFTNWIRDAAKSIGKHAEDLNPAIESIMNSITDWLITHINQIGESFTKFVTGGLKWLADHPDKAVEAFLLFMKILLTVMKDSALIYLAVQEMIAEISFAILKLAAVGLFDALKISLVVLWNQIKAANEILKAASEAIAAIMEEAVKSGTEWLLDQGTKKITEAWTETLIGALTSPFVIVKKVLIDTLFPDLGADITKWFKELPGKLTEAFAEGLYNAIISPFVDAWDSLTRHSIVPEMHQDIINWFRDLPGKIADAFKDELIRIVKEPFEIVWGILTSDTLPRFVGDVLQFFTDLPGNIADAISSIPDILRGPFDSGLHAVGNIVGGFMHVVAKVASAVGIGSLADILNSAGDSAEHWETGGVMGSVKPFRTNGIRAIVGEGNRNYPEYVLATDPQYAPENKRLWKEYGKGQGLLPPMYAGGGIIGAASDALSSVEDAGSWTLDKVRGLVADGVGKLWGELSVDGSVHSIPPAGVNSVRQAVIDFISSDAGNKANQEATQYAAGSASGTGYGFQAIIDYLHMMGQVFDVTSTIRNGGGASRHDIGDAVDIVGDYDALGAVLMKAHPALFELIHNPGFSVKQGVDVDPSFWGAAVWAEHLNHMHIASYTGPNEGPGFPTSMNQIGVGYSGDARSIGRQMAADIGWGSDAEWNALDNIFTHESGWDPNSVNPSSGAYGIPQANPSGGQGHPYALGDIAGQIQWGLNYIAQRYGDPIAAWDFWQQHQWYGTGGILPTFHEGGIVPGRYGMPTPIMALGGERVSSLSDTKAAGTTLTISPGAIKIEVTAPDGASAKEVSEMVGAEVEKRFQELIKTLGTI